MALSTSCLIHLTKSMTALKGIIKEGFRPKYCFEEIHFRGGKKWYGGVPMVSFCDIPLSEIRRHIGKYGHYGIGLSKGWARRHGLNPILYIDKDSTLGADIRESSELILKGKMVMRPLPIIESAVADILRNMKNYEGELKRRNKKPIKNYRYSDEREWRYVPAKEGIPRVINPSIYEGLKQKANELLSDLRLGFEVQDIDYILLRYEKEVDSLLKALMKLGYDTNTVNHLAAKVITTRKIKHDF